MEVICFTTSAGECRSMSRLCILHTNASSQLLMRKRGQNPRPQCLFKH